MPVTPTRSGELLVTPDGGRRPVKLVCQTLKVERSSFYVQGDPSGPKVVPLKRGPKTTLSDAELLDLIKADLADSPFSGEGHRKVWARLRRKGYRVSRKRVLRIMRVNGILAPTRRIWTHTDGAHDGTIIPESPDQLWGTDATQTLTLKEGNCWVFIVVDHYTFDVWADAVKKGNRFAAMEPLREAVIERFGAISGDIARGLKLRHDYGTQFTSDHYQGEIRWLGIQTSPARGRAGRQRVRGMDDPPDQRAGALGADLRDGCRSAPGGEGVRRAISETSG